MKKFLAVIVLTFFIAVPAFADITFTNGGFEDGNLNGWNLWSQTYSPVQTYTSAGTGLTSWSPGTNGGVSSAVVSPGTDPKVGINRTYNGSNAARVGDALAWGYSGGGNIYNRISQSAQVTGTSPGMFYFAWAAVLEISGHSYSQTPFFEVSLINDTQNGTKIYDYLRYEQDSGFWTSSGAWKYSTGNNASYPGWYVESLDLTNLAIVGDTLTLNVLARDCTPSAHAMYVYVDGFGGKPPDPPGVPEPATLLLLGFGLAGLATLRRKI